MRSLDELDAPLLARPAAIVRDRRDVSDGRNGEAGRLQGPQRRLTPGARSANLYLKRTHAVFLGLAGAILCRNLGGKRSGLPGSLETLRTGRRPRNRVALRIGNGNQRIIECRINVCDARRNVLAFAP